MPSFSIATRSYNPPDARRRDQTTSRLHEALAPQIDHLTLNAPPIGRKEADFISGFDTSSSTPTADQPNPNDAELVDVHTQDAPILASEPRQLPTRPSNEESLPSLDYDHQNSRRKRRKTRTPEAAGIDKHAPITKHYPQGASQPISLVEQLVQFAGGESTESNQETTVVAPSDPAPLIENWEQLVTSVSQVSDHPSGSATLPGTPPDPAARPRRTLRLNTNGKLLSSPTRSSDGAADCGESGKSDSTKRTRASGRKRKQAGQISTSRIVILKYGSDASSRVALGRNIEDVIHGRKKYPFIKKPPATYTPAPVPAKPTHPFFLGKAPPKSSVTTEQVFSSHGPMTEAPPVVSRPGESHINAFNLPQFRTTFGSGQPGSMKLREPIEPIWPSHEMIHIRDSGAYRGIDLDGKQPVQYKKRKAKHTRPGILQSESVLSQQFHADCQHSNAEPRSKILRHPKKELYTGNTLQGIVEEVLRGRGEQQGRSTHKRRHLAVDHLLSSIRSSTTSFDRGDCDEIPWTQKYAPSTADEVLQNGPEAIVLRSWLQNLVISSVDTGALSKQDTKIKPQNREIGKGRKKRRKKAKGLDNFIVSSDDEEFEMDELADSEEDELAGGVTVPSKRTIVRSGNLAVESERSREKRPVANSVIISGPSGCGKTAAIYAVAKELGFEVFEINAGSRRSARDVVERVGDMTQNHLVQLLKQMDENGSANLLSEQELSNTKPDNSKQQTMGSFFKQNPSKSATSKEKIAIPNVRSQQEGSSKAQHSQKQSLILLEEVDVLFDEDKQFWGGVLALLSQSKRPVIMTCNDENLLPLNDLSYHAILRFRHPPCDLATDYLFVLCVKEGHILDRRGISALYTVLRRDLRATIMQLNFWCQISVGSEKSGIDWMVHHRPQSTGHEAEAELPKVRSLDTYVHGMGWLSQDTLCEELSDREKGTQLMDCLEQWQISTMDWQESLLSRDSTSVFKELRGHFETLECESAAADVRSDLEILSQMGSVGLGDPAQDILDISLPPIPTKQRSSYTEGYKFLQADLQTDHTRLQTKITSTLSVLLESMLNDACPSGNESAVLEEILNKCSCQRPRSVKLSELQDAFGPVMDKPDPFAPSYGRQAPSFESGTAVVAEDIAPYIRNIVAFDIRLEQRRLALSGLFSQGGTNKRVRRTRASMAALEGGSKASTRRDRWFPPRLNPSKVLATGGKEWQDVLLHFENKEAGVVDKEMKNDPCSLEEDSASSSEGGI
ncbi:hypothetical protein AJ80_02221 [Polytolypa hystricis UAMH7299]|uniref:AAA+ ATPase domain-containing protein n=1 Tax=Polytolypa hystricis (strain UAMH7299) TaxID=1447883 RepID=A0A2B7YRW2_POLH7|nr:hypothetical protein AJ80_02221 [Polytolypa hystricis UAMH7299]